MLIWTWGGVVQYNTGCALTDRHFAKCETNCHVAKNKCVRIATLAKDRFSVYIVMPGKLSPTLAKWRENIAISLPQGCAAFRQAAIVIGLDN